MRSKRSWMLPIGVLLLGCLAGCPTKTPTTPPDSKAAPLPGCQVQRLEDAEQAVRQLHGNSQAYVYKIDGNPATCKLEVFYRPDENSEETLVWSVTDDGLAESLQEEAEALDFRIDPHNYRQVLAVTMPEYPPKPGDPFVLSFSVQATASESSEKRTLGRKTFQDVKEAQELFPDVVFVPSQSHTSGQMTPLQQKSIKPGEEAELVSWHADKPDKTESVEGRLKKVDRVRYRVTVACLESGKLPDRRDGDNDEGKDEQLPETMEEPNAEEQAVAEIRTLGGKVELVREGMTRLELLLLTHTQVTDAGLEHLKGMTNLRILHLMDTQVTDAGLVHLTGLKKLRMLVLVNTQVTDAGLEYVNGMTSLRCIALDSTQVTDAGLAHLKGLTNLQILSLKNTQVTDAGVADLRKSLPKCGIDQ